MFKVSDDLESDDDFLGKEFTEDFFSSTAASSERPGVSKPSLPSRGRSSTGLATKSPNIESGGASALELAKSCDGEESSAARSANGFAGIKSSTPITKGHKTETSPVLLDAADRRSCRIAASPSTVVPPVLQSFSNGYASPQGSLTSDVLISPSNSLTTSNASFAVPNLKTDNVEKRNSDFLAEWNDSFFNAPPEKRSLAAVPAGTPEIITRKLNRAVRQRRFPGPAGLLPPRQGSTSLIAPEEFLIELKSEDSDPTYQDQETEILSQSSGSVFEGGAWSAMLEDLGTSGHSLLQNMNLASIKAIGRNVRSYKVPFLSVLVQTIDASLPDAAVVFKDPTGEMHGVIHRDVWDQFGSDIAVGTVLVLRNVGIISAGVSSRKQVVNITGNNLTAIYSPKDELNIQLRRIHEFAGGASSELLAEWKKVESLTTSSSSPISGRIQIQPGNSPLFNGFRTGSTHPGRFDRTTASRPSVHLGPHSGGKFLPPPTAPCSNQRNSMLAPNQAVRSRAPSFNHRNGTNVSGFNQTVGPSLACANARDSVSDQSLNGPIASNSCTNSIGRAPSASSPFSPMASRLNSMANQNPPISSNHENSSFAGPQKFRPKSAFALKAPANIPSLQHLPITSSQMTSGALCRPLLTVKPPQVPVKKPKLCQNTVPVSVGCQNSITKKNPFQIEADTSAVDSLLEGIDTDSLFGDF